MGVLGQNGGDFLGLGDGEDFCLRSYYVSGQNGVGKPPPPPSLFWSCKIQSWLWAMAWPFCGAGSE